MVLNQRSCDGMLKVYRDAGMSKERLDRLIGPDAPDRGAMEKRKK